MSKKGDIERRQVLRALAVTAALPAVETVGASPLSILSGYHPLVPRQEGEWSPRFFSFGESETVSAVCELIIPETETPGAKAAKVEQYVDFVLSEAEPPDQSSFREGIAWLESVSRENYGKGFVALDEASQVDLLERIDDTRERGDGVGPRFFRDIKQRTIEGYYRSEIGMLQELQHEGNTYLAEFEGCTHPEHLDWEPSPKPADEQAD